MSFSHSLLCTSAILIATAFCANAEMTLDVSHQKKLSVTLYQNGLGFVRDQRSASLEKGKNLIAFEDVSPRLISDSLIISGTGFRINERRFIFDVLNPDILLEKSIGKKVSFLRLNPVTGKEESIKAKILSTKGAVIIERNGHIEVGQPGRLVLDKLPEGLRPRPALLANLETGIKLKTDLALSYLTTGLNWTTSYSAQVNETGSALTLHSWANLTNMTGLNFKKVNLNLAAGQINIRAQRQANPARLKGTARVMSMALDSSSENMPAPAQALGGLHLYSLPKAIDINNKETKQVALMPPVQMQSKRTLIKRFSPIYGVVPPQSRKPSHPQIELSFNNNTGQPLPNGLVRLYRKHSDGNLYFIGEDHLSQTPNKVHATLHPGHSFDVSIVREQVEFSTSGLPKYSFEAGYNVTIKNAKKTAETVRIEERFPGEWDLKKSNIKPLKKQGKHVTWEIDIPANGEKTLTYHVHVRTR